ncbi:MAG TPA: hypothetical protein VGI80_05420 [Pyrinomonadaceae bacterium]
MFVIVAFILTAPAQTGGSTQTGTNQPYVRPDKETREKRFLLSMFGPFAIGGDVLAAGIDTASNSPREWGPHWNGFGKRFASELGKSVIHHSTQYALEESFKLDSYYYRSTKKDVGSRVRNAIVSTFTARRPDGSRAVGFPRIVGSYTASIVAAETWYPNRYGLKDGFKSGSLSLGTDILSNLFKEFFHK